MLDLGRLHGRGDELVGATVGEAGGERLRRAGSECDHARAREHSEQQPAPARGPGGTGMPAIDSRSPSRRVPFHRHLFLHLRPPDFSRNPPRWSRFGLRSFPRRRSAPAEVETHLSLNSFGTIYTGVPVCQPKYENFRRDPAGASPAAHAHGSYSRRHDGRALLLRLISRDVRPPPAKRRAAHAGRRFALRGR